MQGGGDTKIGATGLCVRPTSSESTTLPFARWEIDSGGPAGVIHTRAGLFVRHGWTVRAPRRVTSSLEFRKVKGL